MNFRWMGFSGLAVTLAGCAASTVLYAPDAGCAAPSGPQSVRVSIARDSMFGGSGAQVEVEDGDRKIGRLGPGGSLCWDRAPGEARITCTIRSPLGDSVPYLCAKFRAEAGTTHPFKITFVNSDLERIPAGGPVQTR